jgi:hypothetical protein
MASRPVSILETLISGTLKRLASPSWDSPTAFLAFRMAIRQDPNLSFTTTFRLGGVVPLGITPAGLRV